VGLDIGNTLHHAYVKNAKSTACIPKAPPFANIRAVYMQLFAMLTETTALLAALLAHLSHGPLGSKKSWL
jgi:hypothetical protein